MRLTEHERERLLIMLAADVAERRRGRAAGRALLARPRLTDCFI
jgi:urease gamma subunit